MFLGCSHSSEEDIKDLSDEELLVKHWQVLPDEKKLSLIKDIHNEEKFNMRYTEDSEEFLIMLFDAGFLNTPYYDNNLKKAMKEFHGDREITENSK